VNPEQQIHQRHDGTLKSFLNEENRIIREAHVSGASGSEIVQRRTSLIDRVIREAHISLTASGPMPALLAVGGYGRGELNPNSDIDIMFLCETEEERQRAPELLYQLWDAGLDLGYSVRTEQECVSLARQDLKIRTSLLEARLVSGDHSRYRSFRTTMEGEVFYWKPALFVREKLAERSATRRKFGGSIYLREPNIKEGEGGLRDVHTSLWIAFVHFRISSLSELVEKGVLTSGQYAVFLRSRNFLWRLRNEMHYLSGRKNDHLTFDLQEQSAHDFRYRNSTQLLAVERFMKAYFIHARIIKDFSNIVADSVLPRSERSWFQRTRAMGPYVLSGNTLAVSPEQDCRGDAAMILTAFQIVQTRGARMSDRLKSALMQCKITDQERSSGAAARIFFEILDRPGNVADTLALMKDLRFLGRYIPEFRAIQALARHDYYHMYAVDEHTLLAIRNLDRLWSGDYPALASLRDAFAGLPKRWPLILTVLIHDLGKAYRSDHEDHGAKLAEIILGRLGISGDYRERILFLIQNHLLMSELSQRRELSDPKVIARFAGLVRDSENLSLLYLLTYADIAAVNPGAWTQWKAVLLRDLYLKTRAYLETRLQTDEESQARYARATAKIRDAAAGIYSSGEIDSFLVSMPAQYILTASTRRVMAHLEMVQRLPREQLVIEYRHYPERGYTELTVCAYDAYGMFYRTAGTIAAKNLNILRAQVYTSKNGVMIDTFQITGPDGTLCAYNDAWEAVRTELRAALMSGSRPPEPGAYGGKRPVPGKITPAVEFDNETSDAFTIIDIIARDMIGFLYRITRILYDLNLDIGSAKIVTEGARVKDSFYVTDLLHKKITDQDRLNKIRDALLQAMG
jgi:[protein-PII] uridylyltransferase